jgi:predicted membrane channel-forming protein YqfA (hemolysin III family)
MKPSLRKPFGVLSIVGIIIIWAVIVTSFSSVIGNLPMWLQAPIYIVAGIIWISPLRPLLQWMETGSFKPPHDS